MPYILDMIKSFRDKGLKLLATKGDASKLSVQNVAKVERMIGALDVATEAEDMNVPGWRFHGLVGNQAGRYSVTVTGNWRITFGFEGQDAVDVDLEDYH